MNFQINTIQDIEHIRDLSITDNFDISYIDYGYNVI